MRKLQIHVLTRDGRKSMYETDRSQNVADLKKRIGRTLNVPMAFSRLTYKGRLLTNDCILEDEGVKRMSTLELNWQPLVLTPKQCREKELELDKLDLKQRHVSRMAENYEQTIKKGGYERTPSALRRTRNPFMVKRSFSADDMKFSTEMLSGQVQSTEERVKEELSSTSSDELDFMSAYWCCPNSEGIKKAHKPVSSSANVKPYVPNINLGMDAGCSQFSSVSNTAYPFNMLKEEEDDDDDELLDDLLDQRCKHEPYRAGIRLAAGRMSRSIVSNIRKNKKNCKK